MTSSSNAEHNSLAFELRSLIGYIEPGQKDFATSLANWVIGIPGKTDGKPWSDKQLYWAKKLIDQAKQGKEKKKAAAPAARTFPNIAKLFSNEKIRKLAWPKVKYKLGETKPEVELIYNRVYDCIQARLPGKKLIGTIKYMNGEGREDTRWPIKDEFLWFFNEIEKDPVAAAVISGKLTSCCSFCGRELTDERSVKHGYGPICADNWSLPWDAERDGSTVIAKKLQDIPF